MTAEPMPERTLQDLRGKVAEMIAAEGGEALAPGHSLD